MKIKSYFTFIILLLSFSALQSCFVAKEYKRPAFNDLSEEFYRTDNLPKDSLTMASISWKDFFTDAQLILYIEEALKNNIDIRIALENISIANAYAQQGKSGYVPTLGVNALVTHQENFGDNPYNLTQYELTGNLSWEADIWGKIRSNKRASNAGYLQTVAAHQAVKSQLVASVASLYFRLLSLDEQLKIVEETIVNRTSSIETTQALKEAGQLTEVSVKQTEAQLKNVEALRLDLLKEIHFTENTFSILLGSSPKAVERGNLDAQELKADLSIGYPVQLLRNRPDIFAAEYGLVEAFEMTNVARSQFYPSLTLSVNGGFRNIDLDQLFNANSLFANLIGGITQPVLNNRRIKTGYEVAQARQQQAYLNFKQAVLIAGKEVSDALFSISNATEKIELKTEEYNAYNQAMEYSEELINNGFGNYLEVITARESTLNAQMNLVLTRLDKLTSMVTLYRALGGGWQ